MIINRTNLNDLQVSYRTAFRNAFTAGETLYKRVATVVPSTTGTEAYTWLGHLPRIREWVGERVVRSITAEGYKLTNKPFEATVEVPRTAIEDDTHALYSPLMASMGEDARVFPDELVFSMLGKGFSTNCYDGQFFFDTDHPVKKEDGSTEMQSNLQAGGGTPWFLLDTSKVVKPLIFQDRKKFEFVAKDDPNSSDAVFMRNMFTYGVYGRCEAGYAFWQLGYASKAPLTKDNFDAAYDAMAGRKGDEGRPLGVKPNLLVIPVSLRNAANEIVAVQRLANGADNPNFKLVDVLIVPWL
jgi:phage major head subunit gpT-like protein